MKLLGDTVKKGALLVLLEAMKMPNQIASSVGGKVKKVYVENGASVSKGDRLVLLG